MCSDLTREQAENAAKMAQEEVVLRLTGTGVEAENSLAKPDSRSSGEGMWCDRGTVRAVLDAAPNTPLYKFKLLWERHNFKPLPDENLDDCVERMARHRYALRSFCRQQNLLPAGFAFLGDCSYALVGNSQIEFGRQLFRDEVVAVLEEGRIDMYSLFKLALTKPLATTWWAGHGITLSQLGCPEVPDNKLGVLQQHVTLEPDVLRLLLDHKSLYGRWTAEVRHGPACAPAPAAARAAARCTIACSRAQEWGAIDSSSLLAFFANVTAFSGHGARGTDEQQAAKQTRRGLAARLASWARSMYDSRANVLPEGVPLAVTGVCSLTTGEVVHADVGRAANLEALKRPDAVSLNMLLRLRFDASEVTGKEVLHSSVERIGESARVREGTGTVGTYDPVTDTFTVRTSSAFPRLARFKLTRGCAPHR